MSDKDSWTDPQSEPPVAKKKGMSGCMLASLIVGGIGLVGLVACCGVGFWVAATMAPTISKVPAEVAAVGHQILNTEIIEGFAPDNAMTMDNMIFTMRIAQFKQKEGKGQMMLCSMKIKFGDPAQADLQSRQIRTKFEEETRGKLDFKKTETRDITVNGQKVSVSIGDAIDRDTGKEVHTATADFDQPAGRTFVLLRMDDDVWDEEAVLKMLEDVKAQ